MKKFILFFALLASMPSLFSARASELSMTFSENAEFYVSIDGMQYNSSLGSVLIGSLSAGNHYLEVFKGTLHLNEGVVFDRFFGGYVSIAPNKKIFATIDRYGAFKVLSTVDLFPAYNDFSGFDYDPDHNPGHGNSHGNNNGHGNGHNNGCGNGYNNGYGNGYNPAPTYPNGGYYPLGMAPQTFSMLVMSIRREAFDDNKLNMASHAIMMNGVTSGQLRELMLLLTFDSSRLKLAQLAYASVVDKGNIFLINDAFTFSSSADEFYRSIGW